MSCDSLSTLYSHCSDSPDVCMGSRIELSTNAPIELTKLKSAAHFVQLALDEEITPMLADSCTGGTYLCYNKFEDITAVLKPCDEEPYCINNPKGFSPNRFYDRGITPGTACFREVAAYYLDFDNFVGVPETSLATITIESSSYEHVLRKEGSFQLYIPHECSSEDYGPSMFSTEVSFL